MSAMLLCRGGLECGWDGEHLRQRIKVVYIIGLPDLMFSEDQLVMRESRNIAPEANTWVPFVATWR